MSFRSEAQRRKFGELVKQGKMSQKTFDEWNSATPAKIPERVGKPKTLEDLKKIAKAKFKK
jgi:peptidyl-tRNA hydrolase